MRALVAATLAELRAQGTTPGPKDMGRVMAALKEKYAGQLDPSKSSQMVKKLLG